MRARAERIARRAYAIWLIWLPGPFVTAHSEEMRRLFAERVAEAGRSGVLAVWALLIREMVDVVWAAWRLRRSARRRRATPGGAGTIATVVRVVAGDIGAGARQMLRDPSRSMLAIVVVALGIAATTSTFAIVDSVALRPLPHEDPDRLVMVGQTVPSLGEARVPMAWPNFIDLRAASGTGLADMAAFRWPAPLRVSIGAAPEVWAVSAVSGGLFELLGNRARLGRTITAVDDSMDADVAVLSHSAWQTRFGGRNDVTGSTLTIEDRVYEIIGVMGPEFEFPVPAADIFVPQRYVAAMDDRDTRFLGVVARLSDGVPLEEARLRMSAAMERLVREWPVDNEGNGIRLDLLRAVVLGDAEPVMLLLLGAVLLLLALACASVANLQLARTSSRRAELAMRRALGAGRGRLVLQLLGENLVLAVAGGVAGLALAFVVTGLVVDLVPATLPRSATIGFGIRSFGFAAAATLASGLLFGIAPALRGVSGPGQPFRQISGGVVGRSRHGVLRVLVAVQVAIALVLLVGAGLFVNSFVRLISVDTGIEAAHVATVRVSLPAAYDDPARVDAFFEQLVQRAAAIPGVSAAGATWALPFTRDWASGRVTVEGDPRPRDEELLVGMIPVRGRYFETTGMRLVEGRLFGPEDRAAARSSVAGASADSQVAPPGQVVINRAAARAMWPGAESVTGRRFRRGRADEGGPWLTVIGVVADAKRFGLSEEVRPEVYQMHPSALWARDMSVVVRSEADPLSLIGPLTGAVHDLDPALAVTQVGRLDDFMRRTVAEPRFRTLVVAAFGIAALVLAVAGVYGVLAFTVSLRTREIGIRMALGAGRGRVVRDVFREGGTLVGAGLAIGLLGATAGAGALRSQLFGIGPFDVTTWCVIASLIAAAGAVACWVPARRASHVAPAVAMRE